MRWLVVLLAAGCWGSQVKPPQPSSVPPLPGAPQWSVRVKAPEGVRDFTFETVDFVVATRGERPTLFANARFSTEHATVIATAAPPAASYDELIGLELGADATTVTTLRGDSFSVPYATVLRDARWYDLAPGVLAVMKSATGARFMRFDGSATPTWRVDVADAHLTVRSTNLSPVRRIEWFANGDPLITLDHESDSSLVRLRLATHTIEPVATVPLGRVALAENAGRFAVVFPKATADCQTCDRVAIYDLAGKLITGFAVPDPGDLTPGADDALGFNGRLLWVYDYWPLRRNDYNGMTTNEGCSYRVYDVTAGKRVRTLAEATGEWAKLSKGCKVRALLPTSDGGAIAFAAVDVREAVVVKFAAPP